MSTSGDSPASPPAAALANAKPMTEAQQVEKSMHKVAGYTDDSLFSTVRFMADSRERLRDADYMRLMGILARLQGPRPKSCAVVRDVVTQARPIFDSEPELQARFDVLFAMPEQCDGASGANSAPIAGGSAAQSAPRAT